MPRMIGSGLSRREREILEILHQLRSASVSDVLQHLPDPPTYSAVRSILRILEEKGHIQHREEGKRFLYFPTQSSQSAARMALQQVVQTFFGGSLEQVVKTFLSDQEAAISEEELARLGELIAQARKEEVVE